MTERIEEPTEAIARLPREIDVAHGNLAARRFVEAQRAYIQAAVDCLRAAQWCAQEEEAARRREILSAYSARPRPGSCEGDGFGVLAP